MAPVAALGRLCALLAVGLALLLSGCASTPNPSPSVMPQEYNDPIEDVNRAIFAFNEALDKILFEPLARLYRAIFPNFVRVAVNNILANLFAPVDFANQLLQGDGDGAAGALGRFVVNSTIGLAGAIDVAAEMGLPREPEDFGQTLAIWGVEPGPYVVLPILGPYALRDAVGFGIDRLIDPLPYALDQADTEYVLGTVAATNVIAVREILLDSVDELRAQSVDYYAAVRSVTAQQRRPFIADRAVAPEDPMAEDAFPEIEGIPE